MAFALFNPSFPISIRERSSSRLIETAMEPPIGETTAGAIRGPARRIDFAVRFHDGPIAVDFTDSLAKIADEFLRGLELAFARQIPVEISDEANAEGDAVQVVAVDMASIDLAAPAVSDLDLSIA